MKENISEHKYLFYHGADYRSYEFLGAHPITDERTGRIEGVMFRVWAPRAKSVSVVGTFNDWDMSADPMVQLDDDHEIWELLVEEARPENLYKFAVTSILPDTSQKTVWKADPYAFFSENGSMSDGSQRASIIYDSGDEFPWTDTAWMASRTKRNLCRSPVNIYEIHLGSWRRHDDGTVLSYRETAEALIPYAKDMGYTHIELLPVMEHPFDSSWGYQVTGYYSPTSRYGRPEDLKCLIDLAHRNDLGVIIDWVPAHFPKDEYGLAEFDGYPLFEYTDKLKPEVISFLVSNAFYYCERFHVDGLRVDAVAAMIYLNYGREDVEWMPNEDGGVENKEAIRFLQRMNQDVPTNFPGVMTVAEESTAWSNITGPSHAGGLGFNFKWNMGWMNDELEYFRTDPLFRKGVHGKLVFSLDYAWSKNFILPISHDEVVHGKKSLLDKMPGDYDSKFDGFRTFTAYMMSHPGKKLTFMGTEFAQFIEWNENAELDWLLFDYDKHRQTWEFIRDLNRVYLRTPALWNGDDTHESFRWIDGGNIDDNVIAFMRFEVKNRGIRTLQDDAPVITVLNLSGKDLEHYKVGVPDAKSYAPVIDTDSADYGGHGKRTAASYTVISEGRNGYDHHIELPLPALSAIILRKDVRIHAGAKVGGDKETSELTVIAAGKQSQTVL